MKFLRIITLGLILASCEAPINNSKTSVKEIYGNCGMCKKTIEEAGNQDGISKVGWNKDTKKATITIDSTKTTFDSVLKLIAESGYDNEAFKANQASYDGLHECCKYERSK